ncbi:MAG: HNH endonuclease [Anaerolineales bacterium]|nr:HNH endonuclease [Anaerolineales bacterium]
MENLKSIFLANFPDFKTFDQSGEKYKVEEDNYKREAAERMHFYFGDWVAGKTNLSPDEVFGRIKDLLYKKLEKSGFRQNLTGWRNDEYITETLLSDYKKREEFSSLLLSLLKTVNASQPIAKELDEMISWLNAKNAPPRITKLIPSLVLFFWDPTRFIFIKPMLFDQFFAQIGEQPLQPRLTAGNYQRVLDTIRRMEVQISEFEPRDMIDLQSFVYVVTRPLEEDTYAEIEAQEHTYQHLSETEKESVIQSRLGQGQFRRQLVALWNGCSVTGFNEYQGVLIASHIKPWRYSSNEERLDKHNGLLLLPNLDKLFDKGFITFSGEGKLLVSKKLGKKTMTALGIQESMSLRKAFPKQQEYLKYHREHIFQANNSS